MEMNGAGQPDLDLHADEESQDQIRPGQAPLLREREQRSEQGRRLMASENRGDVVIVQHVGSRPVVKGRVESGRPQRRADDRAAARRNKSGNLAQKTRRLLGAPRYRDADRVGDGGLGQA
jgi:hypothetical protein